MLGVVVVPPAGRLPSAPGTFATAPGTAPTETSAPSVRYVSLTVVAERGTPSSAALASYASVSISRLSKSISTRTETTLRLGPSERSSSACASRCSACS